MNYLRKNGLIIPLAILGGAILFGIVLFAFLYNFLLSDPIYSEIPEINSEKEPISTITPLVKNLNNTDSNSNFSDLNDISNESLNNQSTIWTINPTGTPSFTLDPTATQTATLTPTPTQISADDSGVYIFPTETGDAPTATLSLDLIIRTPSKTATLRLVGTTPTKTFKPTTTLQRTATTTPSLTVTPSITGTLTITATMTITGTLDGSITPADTFVPDLTATSTSNPVETTTPEISITPSPSETIAETEMIFTETPTVTTTQSVEPTGSDTPEATLTIEPTITEEVFFTLTSTPTPTLSSTPTSEFYNEPTLILGLDEPATLEPTGQTSTPGKLAEPVTNTPIWDPTLSPSASELISPPVQVSNLDIGSNLFVEGVTENTPLIEDEKLGESNQISGTIAFFLGQKNSKQNTVSILNIENHFEGNWKTKVLKFCDWSVHSQTGMALVPGKKGEPADIHLLDAKGVSIRNLTNGNYLNIESCSWSESQNHIYMLVPSTDKVSLVDIVQLDEPSGVENYLCQVSEAKDIKVSLDGSKLAYTHFSQRGSQIVIMTNDCADVAVLGGDGINAAEADWMDDNDGLVFTRSVRNSRDIFMYKTSSNEFEQITDSSGDDYSPAIDQLGRIVYIHKKNKNIEIFFTLISDHIPVRLSDNNINESQPIWITE